MLVENFKFVRKGFLCKNHLIKAGGKMKKVLMIILLISLFASASCTKKEDITPGRNQPEMIPAP